MSEVRANLSGKERDPIERAKNMGRAQAFNQCADRLERAIAVNAKLRDAGESGVEQH